MCDSIREGVDTDCLFAGIGFPASIYCCVGVSAFAPVGEPGVLLWIMTLCLCGWSLSIEGGIEFGKVSFAESDSADRSNVPELPLVAWFDEIVVTLCIFCLAPSEDAGDLATDAAIGGVSF